ncbi:uncharacterized protein LOC125817708 [Solanum verrucosum]|uniref:uncharacterized protein LOC125817708 n=1 Tax=Solanum verrucosum TaxID=315347 RepID=UPI0020D10C3A|nr:uncharacterized protein LOC125817708 [Solanum verrucosum]
MPPRRAVKGRPARRNAEEQGVPNAPEVQPQGEVTNAEFREAIRMLSQYAPKIVADMRSRMSLFVTGLSRLSSKEEKFRNKKAKTGNESGQQRDNVNCSSFRQKQKGPAPSSTSAPAPRNKSEYNSQNSQHFRARPTQS